MWTLKSAAPFRDIYTKHKLAVSDTLFRQSHVDIIPIAIL